MDYCSKKNLPQGIPGLTNGNDNIRIYIVAIYPDLHLLSKRGASTNYAGYYIGNGIDIGNYVGTFNNDPWDWEYLFGSCASNNNWRNYGWTECKSKAPTKSNKSTNNESKYSLTNHNTTNYN